MATCACDGCDRQVWDEDLCDRCDGEGGCDHGDDERPEDLESRDEYLDRMDHNWGGGWR